MFIFRSPKSPSADYKRPPLRQSNGFHSPEKHGDDSGRKNFKYLKSVLRILFFTVFITTILLSIASVLLYINCSNTGVRFIPKSHELCHDLYQFLQTGRIPALTWDYKGSVIEAFHLMNRSFSWFVDAIKNFDLLSTKDAAISFVLSLKDAIVGFPMWIYGNGGQMAQLAAKLIQELWIVVRGIGAWASFVVLGFFSTFVEWVKISGAEIGNTISVYWEKMMDTWKK